VPEGDTVHKIAAYLAPRFVGRTIEHIELRDGEAARALTGRPITGVFARGKHLFIVIDDERAIRSHLGMHGSWHRYAPGENWQKPRARASVVLGVGGEDYVCFNAMEVELVEQDSVRERIVHGRLGPDLIADAFDTDALVARAREFLEPASLLADVLLDQRVASGIGNVYKSEVLFIERLLPQVELGATPDALLAACYRRGAELLRQNLGRGPRVTRFERDGAGRTWAYGRDGRPCLRCDGRIEMARLGRHQRSTYWCSGCQFAAPGLFDANARIT
jgi:endonuclease VIII